MDDTILYGLIVLSIVIVGVVAVIILKLNKSRTKLMRNEKRMEEQLKILHSICRIYEVIDLFDLEEKTILRFNANHLQIDSFPLEDRERTDRDKMLARNIISSQRDAFMEFTDLSTVRKRLENRKSLSAEFLHGIDGWLRVQYISVDSKKNKIIYTVQNIDNEKRKEEQLIRMSSTDELTNLYNRKAYEDAIQDYMKNEPTSDFVFVSMDVNGLKKVNDTMGHVAGDELLKGAAKCISRCFGGYGRLYRTGGDEFIAMIFADADELKDLKENFAKLTSNWKGELASELAVSSGFVAKSEFPTMSVIEIANIADKRMYEAKEKYYSDKKADRRS